MVAAFDEESLWSKSKTYVDKALLARDSDDDAGFHLWAAFSLELLAKTALAHIHPALVADPQNVKSLLAACGVSKTTQLRSVTAKTVFERLKDIARDFDRAREDECMTMMNRRNAELHSGQTPVAGLDPTTWVPVFWRNASIILATIGMNLDDWLGPAEAARVQVILSDKNQTGRQFVLGRIERRKNDFDLRCPQGSQQRADAERRAESRPEPNTINDTRFQRTSCPACGLAAWLEGEEWSREVTETDFVTGDGFEGYFDVVSVTYGVEGFECPECNLVLRGQDEIEAANLPVDFEIELEEEPDYEPDFGND